MTYAANGIFDLLYSYLLKHIFGKKSIANCFWGGRFIMDSVVTIRILGTEFKVISTDGEERAKRVAAAVDAKTREISHDDTGAPTTKVALIAAMDFCEAAMKYHRIASKLKKRLEKNEAELERLSRGNGEEEYIEEITSLEDKLAEKEKEIRKAEEQIAVLKEDLAMMESYRLKLAEKEKEIESLTRINNELDEALRAAEKRLTLEADDDGELDDEDLDSFAGLDEFSVKTDETGFSDKPSDGEDYSENDTSDDEEEDEDDIIIPGYLDSDNDGSQVPENDEYGESQIENPFGLDFGNGGR